MSTIIGELLKATGATKQGRSEDDQDFFERIMVATSKLSDDEFDELSEDTQDWCNEASVYINKRKDVPAPSDFGGKDEDEDEKPARGRGRRGRRSAKDEDEKPARGSRRGRGRKAKDEDEDEEVKPARGRRGRGRGKAKDEDEDEKPARGRGRRGRKVKEPEGPVIGEEIAFADITEGMVLSNVDGELEGEVVKKVSRSLILATDGGEEKITRTQAKGSVLEEMPSGGADEEPEEEKEKPKRGRGRGASKPSGRGGRGRGKAKDDGDDTAVGAIRNIMLEDPDMTIDEVGEALEDDGVDFKAATLKLTYESFVAHYELFAKAGIISD